MLEERQAASVQALRLSAGLVLLLVLAGTAPAQPGTATITGRILDVTEQTPVEFANVVLYRLPDSEQVTGTVTDASGSFRLTGVRPGKYFLELSFIGYRTRRVPELECTADATLDLGRFLMEQAPVPVSGVEATAEKPALSYELDRKVIEVSKLPNASTGTAVDALRNVPSVKVDIEDNVTLRGSSNYKVLIDGRPSDLDGSEALKQIPAATIEKIELITNPSAKYEPDGSAGIINVILKKQKGRGISSLLNANAGLDKGYGGDVMFGYKQGIADAYVGGNFNRWESGNRRESERRVFSTTETLVTSRSNAGSWSPRFGGVRAGLGLQLGPNDKTTLTARYGTFDFHNSGTGRVTEHWLPVGPTREYLTAQGWLWDNRYLFGMADHEHSFDTAGHKLAARAYVVNREGRSSTLEQEMALSGDTTRGRRTDETGPWRMLRFESEYVLPVNQSHKLEAGLEARLQRIDQKYEVELYDSLARKYKLDALSSHPYFGTENIYSAYATWSWNWRKLGVQPGLRGEYGNRVIDIADMDSTWQVRRWDIFPTVHLSYSLPANQQVTASYSRRVNRPGPVELRPFLSWQNAYSANRGNPLLRPDYVNSWEAGYELPFGSNNLTAELYYRTTADMSEWVNTRLPPPDTNVLLSTTANVGADRSIGVEFSANLSPVKWLNAFLTADVSDYREWGELLTDTFSRRIFYWNSSGNLMLFLSTSTMVQLNGNFSGPWITAQGRGDGWLSLDAALRQTFLNRALSVTLKVGDILGDRPNRNTTEGPGFSGWSTWTGRGRVLSLALSYNFNSFRLDPKMREGEGIEMQGGGGADPGGGR